MLYGDKKRGGLVRGNALRRLGPVRPAAPAEEGGRKFFWQKKHLFHLGQGRTREQVLRDYVENCFGVSMLPLGELAAAEQALCTGSHKNCLLHFTRGVLPQGEVDGETAWERAAFQAQREKNRAYFRENLVRNRLIIAQLSQRLQNTILLQSDVTDSRARAGRLQPGWRGGPPPSGTRGSFSSGSRASWASCPWTSCWTPPPPRTSSRRSCPPRPTSSPRASPAVRSRCG